MTNNRPFSTQCFLPEPPANTARSCDESACELPWCFCSSDGSKIPGGLDITETPQMVLIMLDGAVNQNNYRLYKRKGLILCFDTLTLCKYSTTIFNKSIKD